MMTETAAEERDHLCMAVFFDRAKEGEVRVCVSGLGWMAGMDRPECIGGRRTYSICC